MKSHVRVVVIGGGVVGCSVLFHLARLGCTDALLLERKELTAGSSWHAAGGFHAFNSDAGMARLQAYTIALYPQIQRLGEQDIGMHVTGGLLVAETADRWDSLKADCARQRVLGHRSELLSPAEVRELCPLMDVSRIRGALWAPDEGHLDPYGTTIAYANAARKLGARVQRQTRVVEIRPDPAGGWHVITEQGSIVCEHVVNAAGLWAREVGGMVGVHLPLVPMEHHYLLTDDLPDFAGAQREMPGILDLDGEIYLRQERNGVLLGVYEKEATAWALAGTPWDYGESELLAPDLDRLTESLDNGFKRFPALAEAGIRRIVNGPFTFTPDGNPLVGPVPGLRNYWVACGVMAGFSQGGGVGLTLAQWLLHGAPEGDVQALDVARFGCYATERYTVARAREFYGRRFQIAYPNEYWPAGRPGKTSPMHAALTAARGVFGVSYGLEIPLYFARDGQVVETPTLRRSNAFAHVGAECRTARSAVALLDICSFAHYEVSGRGAAAALDGLLAGRLPGEGRARLAPMLAESGHLKGDLIVMRVGQDNFRLTGSGYMQGAHMRWFDEHLRFEDMRVENLSDVVGGIAVIGPRSRELLSRIAGFEVTNEALPFMGVKSMDLAFAPALVARLSVSGELGYEITAPRAHIAALHAALSELLPEFGGCHLGMYALNSLRLEKGYGIWSREFSADYTPRMAGLDRFIDYGKPQFIGRAAALLDREAPPARRLLILEIDAGDADAAGYEPVTKGDRLVGMVTSGGFGHCCNRSLAMAYLDVGTDPTAALYVTILGEQRACRILPQAPVDPLGERLRS